MSIYEKTIEIYQDQYICKKCLGRMFSLLATGTTNEERGNSILLALTMENHRKILSNDENLRKQGEKDLFILAENANYQPAQKILQKEGLIDKTDYKISKCHLCKDILKDLSPYLEELKKHVKDIEYETILVGTTPDAKILNNEDKFKAVHGLIESESFKSHLNREIGKLISLDLNKEVDFKYPDLTIIFHLNPQNFHIQLLIRSLFIFGRYRKLIRGIPQTKWFCNHCEGKGCDLCKQTGKMYEESVEELISPEFVEASKAEGSKFHGAGREDIDVRMLGTGRPFVLELLSPKLRNLDLQSIQGRVNKTNESKVEINNLRITNKKEVIKLKEQAEYTKKIYKAHVESEREISKEKFEKKLTLLKHTLIKEKIDQRTPQRVSHRRADKIREKLIHNIEGIYLDANTFEFRISTQGGTYIKELISGDDGRTSPSFSEIFDSQLFCKMLDVIEIDY